jgi:bloom syndrome protein
VKDCERGQACTFGGGSNYINKTAAVPGNRILSQENLNQSTERGCLESYSNHQPTGINSYTQTYQSNNLIQADIIKTTNQRTFTRTDAEMHQTAAIADNMCTDDKLDTMDDDDILAVGAFRS